MSQPDPNSPASPVLVLCRDLLFVSKITGAAQTTGIPVQILRDAAKLDAEADAGRRLLVDLTQDGFLAAAARWKGRTGGHVTGFAGHTDVETIEQARAAGLDAVLAQGAFASNLPAILQQR